MGLRRKTEEAVRQLARADGIELAGASVPWLNGRGHFGVDGLPGHAREFLDAVFDALGGDRDAQASKPARRLPGDFVHIATGTYVEVDESQHFTSARALTLSLYPEDLPLGFDLGEYRDLCAEWSSRADRQFAHKAVAAFGPGGRQRQRAYNDALRDIVAPALGHPPLVRVPAPDRDAARGYEAARPRLAALIA